MSLLARNRQSFGHPKVRPNYLHMSVGVGVGVAVAMFLIYFPLCRTLNESALISITIFNFLFIFLLFPLEGPLDRTIDDARDLVYSDVSTLPSFLKDRHPTLTDELCRAIVRNVVDIFLKELENRM